jgi:SAM-dependent MidA family methyltransferase
MRQAGDVEASASTSPSLDPLSAGDARSGSLPWQQAWQRALYGPAGFFTVGEGPAAHFRTAVHAAPSLLAGALARLAAGHACRRVLDVGAGRGELLTALAAVPGADHLTLHGVDVVDRPERLPERISWSAGLPATPDDAFDHALVVAWELLDDVPCPVLELDDGGDPRQVLVDPRTGREELGPPPEPADLDWCARWWPLDRLEPGHRVEVGRPRDQFWAHLVTRTAQAAGSGVLLAVDYAHDRDDRPPVGTLIGYREGRAVPPVPDGSCNVTAHVALDAVAAAGEEAGATRTRLTDQRTALRELGVSAAIAPVSGSGPEILRQLAARSQAAELLDRASLGGFGWLVQEVRPGVG